jgi:hypothetical protein
LIGDTAHRGIDGVERAVGGGGEQGHAAAEPGVECLGESTADHDTAVFRIEPLPLVHAPGDIAAARLGLRIHADAGERQRATTGTHQTIKLHARHDDLDGRVGAQHLHGLAGMADTELQRGLLALVEGARIGELHMPKAAADGVVAQAIEGLRHEPAGERERREAECHDSAGEQAAPVVARDIAPGDSQAVHAAPGSMAPSCSAMTRAARSTTRGSWVESTKATPRS